MNNLPDDSELHNLNELIKNQICIAQQLPLNSLSKRTKTGEPLAVAVKYFRREPKNISAENCVSTVVQDPNTSVLGSSSLKEEGQLNDNCDLSDSWYDETTGVDVFSEMEFWHDNDYDLEEEPCADDATLLKSVYPCPPVPECDGHDNVSATVMNNGTTSNQCVNSTSVNKGSFTHINMYAGPRCDTGKVYRSRSCSARK